MFSLTTDQMIERLDEIVDLAREALGSRDLYESITTERRINEAAQAIKARLLVTKRRFSE